MLRYRVKDADGGDGIDDVEEAVGLFEQALTALPNGDPSESIFRYNYALALQSRFDAVGSRTGDSGDLHAAVTELETALSTSEVSPQRVGAVLRCGLGSALRRVYRVTGDRAALGRGIGMLGDALATGDQTDLDVADCLYEYGLALVDEAGFDDDPTLLDEAIRSLEQLVEAVDTETPELPAYLDAASSARMARFERSGKGADLRVARKLAQSAVDCERSRRRPTPNALGNLARILADSSSRPESADEDLDQAISLTREAIDLVHESDTDRLSGLRSNLVGFLLDRMDRTNNLGGIDEIVTLADQAVAGSETGSRQVGVRAHQAAIAHRTRYLRFGDPADLRRALALHRIAFDAPVMGDDRLAILDSLGSTLRTLYDQTHRVNDLNKAIRAYRLALDSTAPASPARVARLNNLGAALAELVHVTGADGVAESAAQTLEEAVHRGAPRTLERTRALINLGNVEADRFTRTGQAIYRDAARDAYARVREELSDLRHGSESLLQAALNAAELAADAGDPAAVVQWWSTALDAVDDLLVLQRERRAKESWLTLARGAAARAAQAAISMGKTLEAAALLERGRAAILREATQQTGVDLDRLEVVGGRDLRLQFEALGPFGSQPIASRDGTASPGLRDLRDQIRDLPGFETFMRPMTTVEITAEARSAPLVYLAPGDRRGDAIVVRSSSAEHVRLPGFTEDGVLKHVVALLESHRQYVNCSSLRGPRADAMVAWSQSLSAVGEWLWDTVAAPLIGSLGEGRVVLVAGGLSGVLPLHAAWCSDEATPTGRRFLLDHLTPSYAPSASSLAAARSRLDPASSGRVVTIAEPFPTTLPRLADATAEADVASWGVDAECTVRLRGQSAAVGTVEQALRDCRLLHAGCHGLADVAHPLTSALFLAGDAPLTLLRVLELRTTGPRLAVLSACESGLAGTSMPDEVVSFPSGLIQAGAAGVVASTWAVPEATTLALMTEFYRLWRHGRGLDPADALTNAQIWVRDTPNEDKLAAWSTRVNDGDLPESAYDALQDTYRIREPEALDDARMAVWAPFTHVGA